jgi:hypothetical protein
VKVLGKGALGKGDTPGGVVEYKKFFKIFLKKGLTFLKISCIIVNVIKARQLPIINLI